MTTPPPRCRLITWDWRDQPDLDDLREALTDLTSGQLHLREADTESDQYAVVLSTAPVTDEQVAQLWRNHLEGE